MTRKINFKNIALIIGISIFNIAAGMYDRLFQHSGVLKWIFDQVQFISQAPQQEIVIYNTSYIANTASSGYSWLTVVLIICAGVGIMSLLSLTCFHGGKR